MSDQNGPFVSAADFPAAGKCTYLNAASVALMYKKAETAAVAWQQDIAENGTRNFDEVMEDRVFDDLRVAFSALIGATPDDIAVASCATELIASLAWAVAPGPDCNIVVADVAFPSTVYPWVRVARHTGSEVRWVKARDVYVSEADVLGAIDRKTAVVCLSHVEYAGGQRYDLTKICEAAHEKGALVVVDATQSVGAIPIDIEMDPVDALITGSYKWLCGPFGVGVMYVTSALAATLEPGLVGWRSNQSIYDLRADRIIYPPNARRFEFSTMAYGCAIGLIESIRYLHGIGVERVCRHNLQLAQTFVEALRSLDATIVSPVSGLDQTSIVSARFPGREATEIVKRLGRENIVTSPRRDFVRFSFHLYNTDADVQEAADALKHILAR